MEETQKLLFKHIRVQEATGERGPPKHLRDRSQGPVRHRTTTLSNKLSLALHTIPASECLSLPDG